MKIVYNLIIITLFSYSCSNSKTINQEAPQKNELKSGEKFNIQLPENHTTGYLWQLHNSYNGETIDYMNAVWHGNEKGIYFNFEARNKGISELHFSLIKYKDTLERKTFIISVE